MVSHKKAQMKQYESDVEVVDRILAGERERYRHLVEKYSPMLFHLVRSFEKNEEEVKGIVQDIFVKIYTKLDTFSRRSKFSTWIYSIAMNHCRDYSKNVRRKNKRFSELEDEFIESRENRDFGPDELIEQTETNGLLMTAINSLDSDKSRPLMMRYRDGMSYKAISEELNLTESALKVRVHRARAELKTLLENEV